MSTVPSLSRVAEWLCRATVIEPVTVKFGEAVGQAHSDGDELDSNGVCEAPDDGDGVADSETAEDGFADVDGVLALPPQPATEVATIRPAIASPRHARREVVSAAD